MWIGNNRDILLSWQFHDLIKATLHLNRKLEDSGEATFIEKFLKFTCGSKIINTNKLNELSQLMQDREEEIKGWHMSHFNNTKLQIPQNVLGKEEYTDFLFNYRWKQGSDNLKDIFKGLMKR